MYKKWQRIAATFIVAIVSLGVLVGCGANKENTVHIATKPMTEQFILGEMLAALIEEDTDLNVKLSKSIGGGTTNIDPGLDNGTFDLYIDYLSTLWEVVLKRDDFADEHTMRATLEDAYQKRKLWISPSYGFENNYSIALLKEEAEKLNIKTFSDLAAKSPELTFGGNPDFIAIPTQFPALSNHYDMAFKSVKDVDIALRYRALDQKEIDATCAFTTDSQLASGQYMLLEDDKKFFKASPAVTVARAELFEKHPELKTALEKMTNLIDNETMQKLCYQVDVENADEKKVARNFLKDKGLIK